MLCTNPDFLRDKTGLTSKVPFFARILAVCRARQITFPTVQLSSLDLLLDDCMVGIVFPRARHRAKIRAKSLTGPKKTISIIAHLCSEMAVFDRNFTFRQT
jgi:hypothetical protein